jgi:pentafunctional AROM polypeptide
MHGAAFAATKLPNEYIRVDVPTVEEFVESNLFKSDDFGGTSVTIPHKQSIIPYVDVLSESAEKIGSVNTIIARMEFIEDDFQRVIYGDNTDWKGLYNPLNRILGSSVNPSSDYALILGAGGTARAAAYVANKLGLKPIYYNRTPAKAEELVAKFGGAIVTNLENTNQNDGRSLGSIIESADDIRVVISTLPAAANFELPDWLLFQRDIKPIVFDVNYKPFSTALLRQAEKAGCPVVRGSEMLWEQGVGQFELWTDRTAPYSVMKQIVLQNCQDSTQEILPGSKGSESIPSGAFE